MKKWWQTPVASAVWGILRIWLGFQWLSAGWEKLSNGKFDATGFLMSALKQTGGEHPAVQPFYAAFLRHVAIPCSGVFSFLVQWGEILVGIGLILGALTIPALIAGAFMNLNFMLAGALSTNPILYTVAIILLFVGRGSYYWGVDRFLLPYLGKKFKKNKPNNPELKAS